MQNLFRFWSYRAVDPLAVAGIPVFLSIAWAPALVIFAHLMVNYRNPALRLLLLLSTGIGVSGVQYFHLINGNLTFRSWNLLGSFLLTVAIHILMLLILHIMGHLKLPDLLKTP